MSNFPHKQLTLLFPLREKQVLLGYKKRGFGKGWWNGFGGKVDPNESVEDAAKRYLDPRRTCLELQFNHFMRSQQLTTVFARRELKEESGLVAHTLDKVGLITFEFQDDPQLLDVHIFRTYNYSGTPTESDGE